MGSPARHLPGQEHTEWIRQIDELIALYNHLNIDGSRATKRTQKQREVFLYGTFMSLREIGYKVEPRNIKEKHIRAICEKFEADGISAKTVENYIGYLRLFCVWIRKPGMIQDYRQYFSDGYLRVPTAVTSDMAPDTKEKLNAQAIIRRIKTETPHIWHQLLLQKAFSLSRQEAVMIRPVMSHRENALFISEGTKKTRHIAIDSEFREHAITLAKRFVGGTTNNLRLPEKNVVRSMESHNNKLGKIGFGKLDKAEALKAIMEIAKEEYDAIKS